MKLTSHLRYKYLDQWDKAMLDLEREFQFLESTQNTIVEVSNHLRLVIVQRGSLIFVFNFSSNVDQEHVQVGVSIPGQYRVILDSDASEFDGRGKSAKRGIHVVNSKVTEEGNCASKDPSYRSQINRPYYVNVYAPSRSCIVLTCIS